MLNLCPHYPLCPSCVLPGDPNNPPLLTIAKQCFPTLTVKAGKATGWRIRAKLAVRKEGIGLFKRGSHEVIAIPECSAHHEAINRAVAVAKRWMEVEGIEPYDEVSHTGLVRYLQAVVDRASGLVQLVVVINASTPSNKIVYDRLWQMGGWYSLHLNFNPERTNTIFGERWMDLAGPEMLWETVGGVKVPFHPGSFGQGNLDLFEQMLVEIKDFVPQGTRVAEFYAGTGVIGLSVVDKAAQVQCCEVNPHSHPSFLEAQSALPAELQPKVSHITASVEKALHLLQQADVVIVDPPRKGLDKALVNALVAPNEVSTLIYVSCGWPALVRDAELLQDGGWSLKSATAYVLFPATDHLEVITVWNR